jgi:GntR family transcriptional regulator
MVPPPKTPLSLAEKLNSIAASLAPDEPLPPERALAERFSVSRVTLRKALAELADAGVIYTIHGAGSFVSQPRVVKRLKLLSFSEEIQNRGWVPTTSVISAEKINLASDLDLDAAADATFKIVRLRLGNNEPLSHETTLISESVAPGLLVHDLTKSLYSILKESYGIKFAYAEEEIRPIVVTQEIATLLNLKVGDPAFEINRMAFTSRGVLIEQSNSIRRGDRWTFNYAVKI